MALNPSNSSNLEQLALKGLSRPSLSSTTFSVHPFMCKICQSHNHHYHHPHTVAIVFLSVRPVYQGSYYLTGDLAMMEYRLMLSASQLLRSCGFRHFICPDTAKSNVLVCIKFYMTLIKQLNVDVLFYRALVYSHSSLVCTC